MAKKILIALDDSQNAMRAVDFVGAHFAGDAEVKVLSVLLDTETLCAYQSPELTPYFLEQQATFCALENKKKELIEQTLQEARRRLINSGFATDAITVTAKRREKGIARDIIHEATTGGYSLVAIGKTGLSGIREFFMGSVAHKVVQGAKGVSVLLVE
jgi:nucleotide-binding universal stress UspA family protein